MRPLSMRRRLLPLPRAMRRQCNGAALAAGMASGLVLGLAGCAPAPDNPWFPLVDGQTMVYDVQLDSDNVGRTDRWQLHTQGPRSWQGHSAMLRTHSAGVSYWLLSDAQGVRRVAQQTLVDTEPVADEAPRWVLKAPYLTGTEWTTPTVPQLLERRNEHPRELRHSHRATMHWRIEQHDAELPLPDGRVLKPCLRVVGQATLTLYTDPVNGFQAVPLTSREWYCRGHGLVRLEREERVPPGFFTGGKLVAQWRP